tara:strand:- start:89 stop:652 length:564 start_codon:yes stop_codon:yes gene_type:complete
MNEMTILTEYINTLDVWVVSSGGVGSNYIADFLESNGYKVNTRKNCHYGSHKYTHGRITHLADKIVPDKKCVYIIGDWGMAIKSQERRKLLGVNKARVQKFHKGHIPKDDPYLYVKQYNVFKNASNTVTIKYPFDIQQVKKSLDSLNLKCDYSTFEIKKRKTTQNYKTNLQDIVDIYDKQYKSIFNI